MLVKLDGRLDACTVDALSGLAVEGEVVLDLSGLTEVDSVGIERLTDLVRAGCRPVGGTMYIRWLIREAGL